MEEEKPSAVRARFDPPGQVTAVFGEVTENAEPLTVITMVSVA